MRLLRASLPLFVLACAIVGCRQDDEIRLEKVLQEDREEILLRVAILRNKDSVWFFRIDGPAALVKEQQPTFDAFVKSATFVEKDLKPIQWQEPAAWKKDPPSRDRYASYRIDAKGKELVVKVTVLPAEKFKMMDNMHRWQKQVNLPLSEGEKDNQKYISDEKIGDQIVTWVNLPGLGVHTVSNPVADPIAGQDKDFLPGMVNQDGGVPFKYTAPDGWGKKPPRKMVLEVFEVAGEDKKTEVTLSMAGGNSRSNIDRWRDLIGLGKMDDQDAKAVKVVDVAGVKSYYVDLANPAGPPLKNRTLGVIVPMGRTSFFIKMSGPIEEVGRHKDEFEAFVKSFKK